MDDKCSICLEVSKDTDRGMLEECLHSFCLLCITTWAQTATLCAICKTEFKGIICISCDDSSQSNFVPVDRLVPVEEETFYDDADEILHITPATTVPSTPDLWIQEDMFSFNDDADFSMGNITTTSYGNIIDPEMQGFIVGDDEPIIHEEWEQEENLVDVELNRLRTRNSVIFID